MTLATYTGNTPSRLTGPDTFSADVDYYHAYFTPFIAQFNTDVAALNLNSTTDTSTTSLTIGTGTKSLTVSAGKSFQLGQFLIIANTAAPSTNSMVVQVTSYNSGTGALVVDSKASLGSGTFTAWTITLASMPLTGASGRAALDIKQQESIDYTLASNSLTLKLNPTNLDFRSTTSSSGTPVNVVAASQLTTVISSGSTGGTTSGVQSDIIVLAINNAGTMELAWVNAACGFPLDEVGLISTTADGGAGAADNINTIYSTTARTSVAYRVVGLFRSTQTTAGTWAVTPTLVQGISGSSFQGLNVPQFMHIQDQKASGTSGGASTATAMTRTLNTVVSNTIVGASLASNIITLPAGTYRFRAESMTVSDTTAAHVSPYLQNTSDSVKTLIGLRTYVAAGNASSASVAGRFTITATKTFTLINQYSAANTNGQGLAAAFGYVEVYSNVEIWKE